MDEGSKCEFNPGRMQNPNPASSHVFSTDAGVKSGRPRNVGIFYSPLCTFPLELSFNTKCQENL